MTNSKDIKVGDKLYAMNVTRNRGYEAEIVKIGRQYFYVDIHGENVAFEITTHTQKSTGYGYGYTWVLYESEEAYNDSVEFAKKWRECVRNIESLSRLGKQKVIEIYEAEKHSV